MYGGTVWFYSTSSSRFQLLQPKFVRNKQEHLLLLAYLRCLTIVARKQTCLNYLLQRSGQQSTCNHRSSLKRFLRLLKHGLLLPLPVERIPYPICLMTITHQNVSAIGRRVFASLARGTRFLKNKNTSISSFTDITLSSIFYLFCTLYFPFPRRFSSRHLRDNHEAAPYQASQCLCHQPERCPREARCSHE